LLGVLGMLLVLTTPSSKVIPVLQESAVVGSMRPVWLLALSVFLLHSVMTLLFVVLPGLLVHRHEFALANHWKLYVPAMIASVLLMLPLLRWMGARKAESAILPWAFGLLGIALISLSQGFSMAWIAMLVVAYFLGFNLLEAAMPALVARVTGGGGRGRKMGLYSTFQFLGAFVGGAGGGILLATFGGAVALAVAGSICLVWGLLLARILYSARYTKRFFLTSERD
jgi:MFS family permease